MNLPTLRLPIDPEYVPTWGRYEACRELVQNAADEQDRRGHRMTIEHDGERLVIANEGAVLAPGALLLGRTDKSDAPQLRGKHGEGLALALLVAARSGIELTVETGAERWTPRIAHDEAFGTRCLAIDREECPDIDGVRVTLKIGAADWQAMSRRFLFVVAPERTVATGPGTLLLDERHRGHVFVKGIWVLSRPSMLFGVDLRDVSLDRDRRLIADFDLKWACSEILAEAVARDPDRFAKLVYEMTEAGAEGAEYVHHHAGRGSATAKALADQFLAKHGDAVPVRNLGESREADEAGKRGVLVRNGLVDVLEREIGTIADARRAKLDVLESFGWHELSADERGAIDAVKDAFAAATKSPIVAGLKIEVVRFRGTDIRGRCNTQTGAICIARGELADFYELLTTLVHEVAHAESGASDGTSAFAEHERRLWCEIYRGERERKARAA